MQSTKRPLLVRLGVLAIGMGSTLVLPACSDNPEGFASRGSVSVPRNDSPSGEKSSGPGAAIDVKGEAPKPLTK